jgi:hypothetical protein
VKKSGRILSLPGTNKKPSSDSSSCNSAPCWERSAFSLDCLCSEMGEMGCDELAALSGDYL